MKSADHTLPPVPEPHAYDATVWPVGFRGIGGDLIRPPAAVAPSPLTLDAGFASHGSQLLSTIQLEPDGSRVAACPVCVTSQPLPPEGGWLNVHCAACGTEFVATDGSPPPLPPPPPPRPSPPPVFASPIAPPPVGDWVPLPEVARGFTSDVRIDADGRRFVTCSQCHKIELEIPDTASGGIVLRCPGCHGTFLVALELDPSSLSVPPEPVLPEDMPYHPDARLWDHCPNCGSEALAPDRLGDTRILICTVCGQRLVLSAGTPPRPLAMPAPPSLWERFRKWFGGG